MALPAAGGADHVIAFRPMVEVTAEAVTLADLADPGSLPAALRARAPNIVLARLAPGAAIEVPSHRLMERARAEVPALAAWTPSGPATILLRRGPVADISGPADAATCARLLRSIDGGAFIEADALEASPCGERPIASATWFDRAAGLARASRSLPEGAVIAAPPPATLARYAPGQDFTLSATVGPVRVERPVQAVRPARSDGVVVVRDADGKIHALAATEEARP